MKKLIAGMMFLFMLGCDMQNVYKHETVLLPEHISNFVILVNDGNGYKKIKLINYIENNVPYATVIYGIR